MPPEVKAVDTTGLTEDQSARKILDDVDDVDSGEDDGEDSNQEEEADDSDSETDNGSEGSNDEDEESEDADESDVEDEDSEESEDSEDDEENQEEDEEESDDETEEELKSDSLYKRVKKLNPDIFKKIPELRDIIAKESKYTEIFDTPQEAERASNNSIMLGQMYSDIISGDVGRTNKFLKAIENTNKEGLQEFAHTFLPALGKISSDLYGEVLDIPIKRVLQTALIKGVEMKDKNLAASAQWLARFYFGDKFDLKSEIKDRTGKAPIDDKLEKEKKEYEDTRMTDFKTDVQDAIVHSMGLSIKKALDGIEMSDFLRRKVTQEIFNKVDKTISGDKRYISNITSLFEQAKSAKYGRDWKSRIISAYLGRARSVVNIARNEILKEAGISLKGVKNSDKTPARRLTPGGTSGGGNTKYGLKDIDRRATSDMDILNDTPKLIKR